jgi:trk system potassium uptake protein TrkH
MPLHVIVVLRATAILVFGGALALLAVDWLTESRGEHLDLLNALFQSVSARTAGYNSVNIGLLPLGSLTVLVGLMFIGGSPGSCAGGIKTTTAAVWLGKLRSRLLGRKEVSLMHHTVPDSVVHRAGLIIGLSVLWNVAGLLLLTLTEQGVADAHMEHLLFEQVSAFGTVGLSTGITPSLSAAGKLWIVATMFFGRVGPLTLATWMIHREMLKIRFPNGRIMIG